MSYAPNWVQRNWRSWTSYTITISRTVSVSWELSSLSWNKSKFSNDQLVTWQRQTRKRSRNLTSAEKGKIWFSHRCGSIPQHGSDDDAFVNSLPGAGTNKSTPLVNALMGAGASTPPTRGRAALDTRNLSGRAKMPFRVVNSLDKALVRNNLDAEKVVVVVDRQFHQRA